eukprot:403359588
MTGLIISIFEVAAFIFSPIVGHYLQKMGRKNAIIYGIIIMAVSTTLNGVISLVDADMSQVKKIDKQTLNSQAFFWASMIARFFQGMGDAFIQTSSFSLITIEFQDDQEKYLGWAEAATGMGLAIGPTLGSLVYEEVQYLYTFVIFGGLLMLGGILIFVMLPNRLNEGFMLKPNQDKLEVKMVTEGKLVIEDVSVIDESQFQQQQSSNNIKSDIHKEVTYGMFLRNPRCLITLIGCSMVNVLIDFLNSILSVQLQKYYHLSEGLIGFIFAIPFFVYVIGFYFVSKIVVKFDKRISIFISFVISSLSLFLTGPSETLKIPQELWILIIGYFLLSIGCLFFFIASLPEIIDSVIISEDLEEENHTLNDKASGIFNGFVAFGAIIAPIVGGTLSDAIGYPNSNDILALSSSSYTLAFVAVSAFAMRQPKNRLGGGNNHGHHLSVMRSNSSYKFKNSVDTRRYGNSLNQDNVGIEDQLLIKQFGDSYLKDNKLQDVKLQKEGNRTDQAPVDYQDDENRNNSFLSGQNQKEQE